MSIGDDLSWLPAALPPSVRLLVSVAARPDVASSASKSIEKRRPGAIIELRQLEEPDIREIADKMMKDYGKDLSASRLDVIQALEQAKEPLFLAVLMRELRSLGGDAAVDKYLDELGGKEFAIRNASDLFRLVLKKLEGFGDDIVAIWATSLAISRSGLTPAVLAQICAESFGEPGRAASYRIGRSMRPYLQRRANRIDFFHLDVEEAVTKQYSGLDQRVLHADIAVVLQTEWTREKDAHAMAERFYHLVEARDWDAALTALADVSTLEERFDLSVAGLQFSSDVDLAYRTALESGRHDIAKAIVQRFLAILKSDAARRAAFTLSRVSAWLAYRADKRFYLELLKTGGHVDGRTRDD